MKLTKKFGIGIHISHDLQAYETLELAKLVDKERYDSIWKAEDYFYRDGTSALSAIATQTEHVKVGTNVINPYTRNPALIAMTAATIDEFLKGRFILGLGSGIKGWIQNQMGIKLGNRLTGLREAIEAIRMILTGELVNYEGKEFTLKNIQLGFKPYRKKIPIYLAAVGPKMLQLAGEMADGVILTGASSPRYIKNFALENLRIGAERSGKSLDDLDICCNILFSLSEDFKKARELTKYMIGLCLSAPEYANLMMKESGMDETLLTPIYNCIEKADLHSIPNYVTDEMAETFAISGDKRNCEKQLLEYIKAGVNTPILFILNNHKQTIMSLKNFSL